MLLTLTLVLAQSFRPMTLQVDSDVLKVANGIESLSSKIVLTEVVRNKTFARTELSKEIAIELESEINAWPSARTLNLNELRLQLAAKKGISNRNPASYFVFALYMMRDLNAAKWDGIMQTKVMETYANGIGFYIGDWNGRTDAAPWKGKVGSKQLAFDRAILSTVEGFSIGGWIYTFKSEEFSDFWEK